MTPEMMSKIQQWRQKAIDGTLSEEEMFEAVRLLREDRTAALAATTAKKKREAAVMIPDADDLLKELGL